MENQNGYTFAVVLRCPRVPLRRVRGRRVHSSPSSAELNADFIALLERLRARQRTDDDMGTLERGARRKAAARSTR